MAKSYNENLKERAARIKEKLNSAKDVFNLFCETVNSMKDFGPINNEQTFNNLRNNWFMVIISIAMDFMKMPAEFPRGGFDSDILKAAKVFEDKWWGHDKEWQGGASSTFFF